MFALVITVHVIVCALLIIIVLIQQGRGGGLIDNLSSAESIFGTKTSTFLVKATSVLSVIFFFTCLSLAFLSIQKNKSLIETSYKPSTKAQTASTTAPAQTPPAPAQTQTQASPAQVTQTQAPAAGTTQNAQNIPGQVEKK